MTQYDSKISHLFIDACATTGSFIRPNCVQTGGKSAISFADKIPFVFDASDLLAVGFHFLAISRTDKEAAS